MDHQPAFSQASASNSGQSPQNCLNTPAESAHQRDRRREKPQLSCTFCRSRKVRCDRQIPCKTCINKGIALSCTYAQGPQRKGIVSVGERIQQLEAMVRTLVQQQQQTLAIPLDVSLTDSSTHSYRSTSGESPQSISLGGVGTAALASTNEDTERTTVSSLTNSSLPNSKDRATSPLDSEDGSLRLHSHGKNYVNSTHWAAVLHSISELKDHYEKEEEGRMLTTNDYIPRYNPGPRLLYEPVQDTKADILASIPARPVADRMVARYFNAQGVAPVLYSGQFLQEYESFWQDPAVTSFAWIGLLFSIMCLSTQYERLAEEPEDPDTMMQAHIFRERTVHCLVLAQFTKGGPHVLETMIIHCASEVFMCKDPDIGLWLLVGIIVQLALSMGYHRDPRNFPTISPFAGEMRRRVWAAIVQIDLRLAGQVGLPRLIKLQQCDTAEPGNLLDSDFNQATVKLPPSRPETEVTPVLYSLAKNKIDKVNVLVSDLVADAWEHPYPEIMELDRKLREAEASLPPIFQWQPLSQSLLVPPQIVFHRVFLQLTIQRLIIWLHRKYLAPSYAQARYSYSRDACVQAAIKIIEFQQLIEEEMQPHGLLQPVRWMRSPLLQSVFLLGMSVLCYYMQLAKATSEVPLDQDSSGKILSLLRNTYPMWLRSSTMSEDARKAVEHLSLLLGLRGQQEGAKFTQEGTAHIATPQDAAASLDEVTWDAYQEFIADFPAAFGVDFMAMDAPAPASVANEYERAR